MNFSRIARPYATLTNNDLWNSAVRDIVKQLPPATAPRLLDLACGPGYAMNGMSILRPDVQSIGIDLAMGMLRVAKARNPGLYINGDAYHLPFAENSFDAVLIQRTYYFLPEKRAVLDEAMRILRPGGRLIVINPMEGRSALEAWKVFSFGFLAALDMFLWRFFVQVIGGYTPESLAAEINAAGFARIFAEPIMEGWTVMGRGEKPYAEGASTPERIAVGATDSRVDGEMQILQGEALQSAPGKYIHLLIHQNPNKPVWKLQPGEVITWGAAMAFTKDSIPIALAFSSLPKAVAFMQGAVMDGKIKDIHKVAKFSKDTAAKWDFPVLLNPTLEHVEENFRLTGALLAIDPDTAESPDE